MNREERKLIEQQIIEEALDLSLDESKRTVCPFCEAKHELSFSVIRINQGLLYNCYRGKCGAKGFITSIPSTTQLELVNKKKKFEPKEFTHELESLPEWVINTINKKYEITEEQLNEQGFKWVPKQHRIWMPLFDKRNSVWGSQTKIYTRAVRGPKTIIYRTKETSGLHYIQGGERRGGPIVLSEDVFSAVKISRYVCSVTLLGTHLNNERIAELRDETDSLILMLDPDMYSKMVGYKRKYSFYFRNFSVILLSKDPKDTKHSELKEIFAGSTPSP